MMDDLSDVVALRYHGQRGCTACILKATHESTSPSPYESSSLVSSFERHVSRGSRETRNETHHWNVAAGLHDLG